MPETQKGQPEFHTLRLRLRPLRMSDAGVLSLYASDPRVARMTTTIPHPYPPGSAEALIARSLSPAATETVWAMDTGGDDENGLVGVIGLRLGPADAGEIGYWVAPAFWRTGYASEAVEAVVGAAADMGLAVLQAQVFQDNAASAKVLTRAGFAYVGDGEAHSVARAAMVPTFRYRLDIAGGAAR